MMSLASEQSASDVYRSSLSNRSDTSMQNGTSWRYSVGLGRGPMLFTGPDGIRDHRQRVVVDYKYVGEGTMSPEGSCESGYLWRSPANTPHPRPKSRKVGEIGWGVMDNFDWFSSADTGAQIQLGEFRQVAEDRHTHIYQDAWSPEADNTSDDMFKRNGEARSKSGCERSVDYGGNSSPQNSSTQSPVASSPTDVTPKASFESTGKLGQVKSGEELLTSGSDNSIGHH